MVAGAVPYALTEWRIEPPMISLAERPFGVLLIVPAVAALVECFARFALVGRGTPAPVSPPETLVVSGLYRHTRNPMYVAVTTIIVGQAFVLGQPALLAYAAIVWSVFHLFVIGYEEPALDRQFANYRVYQAHVPRWLPRLRPWTPPPTADVPATGGARS